MGAGALERITPRIRAALCCVLCACVAACGGASQPRSQQTTGRAHAPTFPAPNSGSSGSPPVAQGLVDTYGHQLRSANAALGAPKKLDVGQAGTVDIKVSRTIPISVLQSKLGKAGTKVGVHVRVSDQMTARLVGAAFTITPISPLTQAVGTSGLTDWQWQVTPKEPGAQQLHASLTASVLTGRRLTPTPYQVQTFSRTLQIQAVSVPITTRITNFLSANWVWIAGIAGAIGVAFGRLSSWKRRRANRSSSGLSL